MSSVAFNIKRVKTRLDLDKELVAEIEKFATLAGTATATVLRSAIRADISVLAKQYQSPKPDGYFSIAYRRYPKERLNLENAFAGPARK